MRIYWIFCVISSNFGIMGVKSETQNFSCRQLKCHNSTPKVSPKFLGRVIKCRRISNVISSRLQVTRLFSRVPASRVFFLGKHTPNGGYGTRTSNPNLTFTRTLYVPGIKRKIRLRTVYVLFFSKSHPYPYDIRT